MEEHIEHGGSHEVFKRESQSWLENAKKMHAELLTHPLAWPFLEPVDPIKLNIPTYFQIIEFPMDLGTIQAKLLLEDTYNTLDEYKHDLLLVFKNAIKFNADDGREDSVGYMNI